MGPSWHVIASIFWPVVVVMVVSVALGLYVRLGVVSQTAGPQRLPQDILALACLGFPQNPESF